MKLLIIYTSNSGSTYQTATQISETLEQYGHKATVIDAKEATVDEIINAETVLFGSPSWEVDGEEGKMLEYMSELLTKLKDVDLSNKKMAFFGCGDESYTHFCGAVDDLVEFGKSKNATEIIPALKVNDFYFNINENTEMIKAWAQVLAEQLSKNN